MDQNTARVVLVIVIAILVIFFFNSHKELRNIVVTIGGILLALTALIFVTYMADSYLTDLPHILSLP